MIKHRKIIGIFVALSVFIQGIPLGYSQTGRMRLRLPTSYGQRGQGAPSSFRGTGGSVEKSLEDDDGLLKMPDVSNLNGMSPGFAGSDYHVHVLGEVMRPGTYIVSASARLSQALKYAGGIAPTGSMRRVELRRAGHTEKIDLLNFETFGSLKDNPYLVNNDVVFVPLKKSVIQIVGAVSRPGEYELKNEHTLGEIIKLAGNYSVSAAKNQPIKVIRFDENGKNVLEVNNSQMDLSSFQIKAGDVVYIPNIITAKNRFDYNIESLPGEKAFYPSFEDRVFILGGVNYPGAYPFSPYYTIGQYLSLAGGISDRGANKFKITGIDGKKKKAAIDTRVNPGDTIYVKQHWMSPVSWIGFMMGIASFGLSVTATTLALTR